MVLNYILVGCPWINEALVSTYMTPCPASQRQRKIRRHKRPCAYYSNTTATFHALLIGDLVFKLNPGPTGNCIPVVVSTRSDHRHIAQLSRPSRNPGNLININCSTRLNGHYQPMTSCTFNACSVKNKSADIVDYVCECKAPDLFAITETWLSADDAAVRAELCPDGYKFTDHPRFGRRRGGTGLVYRSSLGIKKVDTGERASFEFSEWIVTSPSLYKSSPCYHLSSTIL